MEKLNGKIEFYYKFDDGHPEIVMTLSPEADLSQLLETFEGFLRAAGYSFEGIINITNEDGSAVGDDFEETEEAVN